MIKIIMKISDIEYDGFIDRLLDMAKEHPEQLNGAKIPPGAGKMLKMIPRQQKNQMITDILNRNKDAAIPQIQQVLTAVMGPVAITDMDISYDRNAACPVSFMIEASQIDTGYIINNVMPGFYVQENGQKIMGENYDGPLDLPSVQSYMRQLDYRTAELLIARGMSANKTRLMQDISSGFAGIGIQMQLKELHLYVK